MDNNGRRFWFFGNDPKRLWVEAPKGQTVARQTGNPWAWAFYDTTADVNGLMDSLDSRGQGCEAKLKRVLRDLEPIFTYEMQAEAVTNKDEGWLDTGHEWIGQKVLRMFDGEPSTGKRLTLTRYPSD